jgi:hypothetical protein
MNNWYGLVANGELIAVQTFHRPPTIFDFNMGYMSWIDYEIVEIDPVIISHCERLR